MRDQDLDPTPQHWYEQYTATFSAIKTDFRCSFSLSLRAGEKAQKSMAVPGKKNVLDLALLSSRSTVLRSA